MPDTIVMKDAAYPWELAGRTDAIAGYLPAPRAFHPWRSADWAVFGANRKLPIWVAGQDGEGEAWAALQALFGLGVPGGAWVALDMEARIDRTYVARFGRVMAWARYKVAVYGSLDTVAANPALDGQWVAVRAPAPTMAAGRNVVATQWEAGAGHDTSEVLETVAAQFWV